MAKQATRWAELPKGDWLQTETGSQGTLRGSGGYRRGNRLTANAALAGVKGIVDRFPDNL
ncbi:MAG: hypothetical protein CR217_07650 [Beijerinckiaceae bacterium]|nr:MAG: hypothetical protein CR217_07650 [Beijerinckiaceae bacterium]